MMAANHKYYRHFKGGLYKLLGFAKDSETLEDLVVSKIFCLTISWILGN